MTATERKLKSEIAPPKTLRQACEGAGLTVDAAAKKIGRARNTLYLAWERPSRYPVAFQKLTQILNQ